MQDAAKRRQQTQRKRYPKNWRMISRRVRFERAQGRCEWCAKPHGVKVQVGAKGCWAGPDGQWRNEHGKKIPGPLPWPTDHWWKYVIQSGGKAPAIRESVVVLQTAHLDHNPANCDEPNLAALCQFCHATHDVGQRQWSGGVTQDLRRGQKVLFG
jgi:hypothetical protein